MLRAPAQCLTSAICSVGRYKRQMAEICVKAVIAVADLQRKDVNLELIKVCTCCQIMAFRLLACLSYKSNHCQLGYQVTCTDAVNEYLHKTCVLCCMAV